MPIAISIRQPWAALIVLGFKDIENRTWQIPPRWTDQRISVHAGMQPDPNTLGNLPLSIREAAALLANASGVGEVDFERKANANPNAFELGGIVGRVTIRGCSLNGSTSYWADTTDNTWHWQLAEARPVPFIKCKGRLGFFDPTKDIVAAPNKPQTKQASLF